MLKKLLAITIAVFMSVMIVPIHKIAAEENELQIPLEIADKLETYITTPNDSEAFANMNDDEVVVYIENYKITRGDMIPLLNGDYMIDVTRITEEDYVGPERNTRAITYSYVLLGTNSVGATYRSATVFYKLTNVVGYWQTTKRRYVTTNQINQYFIAYPSTSAATSAATELVNVIKTGIEVSITQEYWDLFFSVTDFVDAFNTLTKRNAFRTYMAGGNGGYTDEIRTSAGTTRGYGVWNQSSLEVRTENGGSSGQTVVTTIYKSTKG